MARNRAFAALIISNLNTLICHAGTVQIHIRHAGGVRGVRHLVVSRGGVVATAEAEERKEPDKQDERVSAGVPTDLQADSAFHDRGLCRGTQGRQQGEEQRRLGSST